MTRRFLLTLLAVVPVLAAAAPSTQPAKVPAFVEVGYTDGTTERKFNLSADDLAFLRSAFPAKPATPDAPAPEPDPTPLPSLTMTVAPTKGDRGDGVTMRKATPTLANAWVEGWRQNIVAEGIAGVPVVVENVRSLNAHANKGQTFVGQSGYFDKLDRLTVREFYGFQAGWQPGMPLADLNAFRHHLYDNYGVKDATIEDCWLDAAAACAIQVRGPKWVVRRCLLTRNAIAILAVMGEGLVEDSTIYDGHPQYTPPAKAVKDKKGKMVQAARPANGTANTALQTYTTVRCRNVWIVGHPDQAKVPPLFTAAGLKTYNLGAVLGGAKYTGSAEWDAPKGPDGKPVKQLVTAENCRIAGWPGPTFAGDKPADGSGWTVAGGPVDAWPLLEPIRANLLANKITVREAVARGQAAVRGLVELQSK